MKDDPILIYENSEGDLRMDVKLENDTVLLTQDQMSLLFQKAKSTINEHIRESFAIRAFMKKFNAISFSALLIAFGSLILAGCSIKNESIAHLEIQVIGQTEDEATVSFPVNGTNFWANKTHIFMNNESRCSLKIPREHCGLVLVRTGSVIARLIISPGDHVSLRIDGAGVVYKGNNAEGHRLFNSFERRQIRDVDNPYKNDSLASMIEGKINDKKVKELVALRRLRDAGDINGSFFDIAVDNVKYYYAASLADALFYKYYYTRLAKEHGKKDSMFREEYRETWKNAFEQMPMNQPTAINTEFFKDYAGLYYEWYAGDFLGEKKRSGIAEPHEANYQLIDEHYKGKIAEYLKAQYLYFHVCQKTYERSLVSIYQKFVQQYPGSDYIPFIKSDVDSIIAFNRDNGKSIPAEYTIIPHYRQINSLAELLQQLKGETYYVDIWSTWCVPCIEEFSNNPALYTLLRSSAIKILYLSIDKDSEDGKWREMIKHFKLSGLQMRTNDLLRKDIMLRLGSDGIFGIPRYLLVGKDGSILVGLAARPSDTAKLHLQISGLSL